MHTSSLSSWQHSHNFLANTQHAERKTRRVLFLNFAMMIVEIIAGLLFHSMALLADGLHMSTHVAAFGITAGAYAFARRFAEDRRFTFGAGKAEMLGGFSSAILLAGIAVFMAVDSALHLFHPVSIRFSEALPIACVSLAVNLISALILKDHPHTHTHEHLPAGSVHHHHHAHDQNMRAAYLHVIADAFTSILAIIALAMGKFFGWTWLDAVMGIVGAMIVGQWAYTLILTTGAGLLDREADTYLISEIRTAIESDSDAKVCDLHTWQIGSGKVAAIISLVTHAPKSPDYYKALLKAHEELVHVTVEVHQCPDETTRTCTSGSH